MEIRLNGISLDTVLSYALKTMLNSGRIEEYEDYEDEEYREVYKVIDISLNDDIYFDEALNELIDGNYNISVLVKRSILERDEDEWCVYADDAWMTLNKAESAALRAFLKEV